MSCLLLFAFCSPFVIALTFHGNPEPFLVAQAGRLCQQYEQTAAPISEEIAFAATRWPHVLPGHAKLKLSHCPECLQVLELPPEPSTPKPQTRGSQKVP